MNKELFNGDRKGQEREIQLDTRYDAGEIIQVWIRLRVDLTALLGWAGTGFCSLLGLDAVAMILVPTGFDLGLRKRNIEKNLNLK